MDRWPPIFSATSYPEVMKNNRVLWADKLLHYGQIRTYASLDNWYIFCRCRSSHKFRQQRTSLPCASPVHQSRLYHAICNNSRNPKTSFLEWKCVLKPRISARCTQRLLISAAPLQQTHQSQPFCQSRPATGLSPWLEYSISDEVGCSLPFPGFRCPLSWSGGNRKWFIRQGREDGSWNEPSRGVRSRHCAVDGG